MNGHENIVLNAAELIAQSESMKSLEEEYNAMFSQVTSVLNQMNDGWSENLANNFVGKIATAQKGFAKILEMLQCGQSVAKEAATSFEDINAVMARQISGAFSGLFESADFSSLAGLAGTGINIDLVKQAFDKINPFKGTDFEGAWDQFKDTLGYIKGEDYGDMITQLEKDLFGTNYIDQLKDGTKVISDLITGDMKSDSIEALSNLLDLDAIGDKIGFSDGTGMSIIVDGLKKYFDPENPVTLDYLEDMKNVGEAFKNGDYYEAIAGGFFHTLEGSTKIVSSVLGDTAQGLIEHGLRESHLDVVIDALPMDEINNMFKDYTGVDLTNAGNVFVESMSEVFSERVDETIKGIPIVTEFVGEQIGNGIEYVGDALSNVGSAIGDWFGF